jgi:uncharacterized protein YjiS (DUF1127 family)
MATHVLDHVAGGGASFAERWAERRQRFLAWREKRRERARVARELLSYSDRELFDLGISRADIPAVINGTYRR